MKRVLESQPENSGHQLTITCPALARTLAINRAGRVTTLFIWLSQSGMFVQLTTYEYIVVLIHADPCMAWITASYPQHHRASTYLICTISRLSPDPHLLRTEDGAKRHGVCTIFNLSGWTRGENRADRSGQESCLSYCYLSDESVM